MNWTQVISSLGSVAVVIVPAFIAHYKKLGSVLDAVTQVLDAVEAVEKKSVTQQLVNPPLPTRTGNGMVNENTD